MSSQIALITGGSRGIGRSAAIHLAEAGIDIVVTYRSDERSAGTVALELKKLGRAVHALKLDVGDVGSQGPFVSQLTDVLQEKWGRSTLDIVVNNGGTTIDTSAQSVTEEEFDSLINVHFKGVLFLTQKLIPMLADGARIVNVSSGLTRFNAPNRMVYAAAKSGMEVMSRYLADELGHRGITVNVVAPGAVATDLSGGRLKTDEEFRRQIAAVTALGRVAEPDDVGAVIAALVDRRNRWVTGQRIEVSGGMKL